MDDQLKGRIRELARQLLAEQKTTFRKARTLLEIETLTAEIGDELTRQLATPTSPSGPRPPQRSLSIPAPPADASVPSNGTANP